MVLAYSGDIIRPGDDGGLCLAMAIQNNFCMEGRKRTKKEQKTARRSNNHRYFSGLPIRRDLGQGMTPVVTSPPIVICCSLFVCTMLGKDWQIF